MSLDVKRLALHSLGDSQKVISDFGDSLALRSSFDRHELILYFNDIQSGLRGFIVIHNTNLGPATGGTRMYFYKNEHDALVDVLNLSKAMTYKCALARVPFGGGKAVIIGDPEAKTEEQLRAYGKRVNLFGGMFTTGTAAGVSDANTSIMAEESSYILGQKKIKNQRSTSEMAALGVFQAIEAALMEVDGATSLAGKVIGVKGVGKLGGELVRLLVQAGAVVKIADINIQRTNALKLQFPSIHIVPHEIIHSEVMDIYAPCAMGYEFTAKTVSEVRARMIVGGANNQLAHIDIGDQLFSRNIFYAPDYVVNAGGLINIVDELGEGGYTIQRVNERIHNIGKTLRSIWQRAKETKIPPHRIADMMAETIIYET